jgi:uncharacterized protein
MSTLSEATLQERLKEAMRARAMDQVMVLRGLVAAIKNRNIERRTETEAGELGEAEITQIVRREIKQREEAMSFAEQAKRADLVEKNRTEKAFLESFLPQALPAEEITAAIARHYQAGATSIGALMAKLKQEFGSRLDGRAASEAVRAFLRDKEGS